MGGPKPCKEITRHKRSRRHSSPLERVTHTVDCFTTQYLTRWCVERPSLGCGWPDTLESTAVIIPICIHTDKGAQIWDQLSVVLSPAENRWSAIPEESKKAEKREVTLTTLEPFNCRGLDISSKPLTSCMRTQCHGACALTQHLFYLLADWTHFTVKRGQLGCKGIKNTGKKEAFSISSLL